ncbi:hypothetical protein CRG98_011765 [Punica granatum]|uniref:Uncharacterized protein n=1 Tax=Punica granatum TaxID=22663 RepID=A0A2I0KJA0_PUNGR|nr:hypothetical protein CRG98_011765 [Punica granatum]
MRHNNSLVRIQVSTVWGCREREIFMEVAERRTRIREEREGSVKRGCSGGEVVAAVKWRQDLAENHVAERTSKRKTTAKGKRLPPDEPIRSGTRPIRAKRVDDNGDRRFVLERWRRQGFTEKGRDA